MEAGTEIVTAEDAFATDGGDHHAGSAGLDREMNRKEIVTTVSGAFGQGAPTTRPRQAAVAADIETVITAIGANSVKGRAVDGVGSDVVVIVEVAVDPA